MIIIIITLYSIYFMFSVPFLFINNIQAMRAGAYIGQNQRYMIISGYHANPLYWQIIAQSGNNTGWK